MAWRDALEEMSGDWTNADDETFGWRWLKKSEYSCGSFDCTALAIVSRDACSGGYYVRISWYNGSTAVSWSNNITAGVSSFEISTAILENASGQGSTAKVTDIHCLS